MYFNNLVGGERFLKLFWILSLHIFRGKTNILACESQRNFLTSVYTPFSYKMQKYWYKNYSFSIRFFGTNINIFLL